jgi:RNA polymerase sigma-70 factor (ECF subfamily)
LSNRRMDKAETEAIRDVLAGDRDAYRVLMDRHFCSVARVAFRITGNEADAEEAAQEAFLLAYNKLPSFRQDSAFSTWIIRITMNTAINLVERRKRDLSYHAPRIADEPSIADHTVQIVDRQAGPEVSLLNREAVSLRQAAMAELTPMERTAFTLRHMEDVPMAEIAAALNITSNSAKQAVFRAVSKLRRSLTPIAGGVR